MTVNTDTLTRPDETAGGEATGPAKAQPPSPKRRSAFAWIALTLAGIAVAALAFATFTGGDSAEDPVIPFNPQADQAEREAHLEGNARTYARVAELREGSEDEFVPGSGHMPTR